jgi:Pregnancy-associated plasma protein-A
MNDAYATIGITFVLNGGKAERVKPNADWATWNSDRVQVNPAVPSLRKGTYRTLNLFFVERLDRKPKEQGFVKGYCTFPQKTDDPIPGNAVIAKKGDGCVIRRGTMPGWSIGNDHYRGVTAIHEVGHWLGLLHTFSKGLKNQECAAPGDHVADTPYETKPSGTNMSFCRERDTCPQQPGMDPIHNFMTYGPE